MDWTPLHAILENLTPGSWTTYGDLATAIGSGPQAVASHLQHCGDCPSPYRVLNANGEVAVGFAWLDPNDDRDPAQLLDSEGVTMSEGRASRHQRVGANDLQELLEGD